MKRHILIGLAICLLLAMTGCGKEQESDTTAAVTEQTTGTDMSISTTIAEGDTGGTTNAADDELVQEFYQLAETFTSYLNSGDSDSAYGMLDETMKAAVEGQLDSTWSQLISQLGDFKETGAYEYQNTGEYHVLEMTLYFENGSLIQRTTFDQERKISGLYFNNGEISDSSSETEAEAVLPEWLIEEAVTVDAGDGYPLDGLLTMPSNGNIIAAVVLVHGSGPSDMNESVGANHVFQDLAYELAQEGFAVLRYDKRTYTYGAEIVASPDYEKLTVDDETVYDAVAAVNLLKARSDIDESKVYLLGHSMGGGLLSYIDEMGADCAGYIVMAGTTKKLWESSAAQNLLVAEELEEAGDAAKAEEGREYVSQQAEKAELLADMSDEDALKEESAIFGISAWYLRKFEQIDTAALHLTDGKPILILQGEKDQQVTMEDFELWKKTLAGHPDVTYISYPQLNHLFGNYQGEAVSISNLIAVEYAARTPVDSEVTKDIGEWLTERGGVNPM